MTDGIDVCKFPGLGSDGMDFCKFSGLGTDGIDLTNYPNRGYQLGWIRDYLQCKAKLTGRPVTKVTDADVEDCCVKANNFALVRIWHSCENIIECNILLKI